MEERSDIPRICLYIVTINKLGFLSYYIFLDVAESYKQYLQLQGYDVVISEQPMEDRKNIIFGCNVYNGQKDFPKNSIIVDLEQLGNGSVFGNEKYLSYLRRFEVWTYSRHNVNWLTDHGVTNVKYVPVAYMPCIEYKIENTEDIDILFIGNVRPQRRYILRDTLKKLRPDLNVVFQFGVWGVERDKLMKRAKILLNIGSSDVIHLFESVRVIRYMANKKFVISENAININEYLHFAPGLVICPYKDLVSQILKYISLPEERKRIANIGYELVKKHPLVLPPIV